MSATPFVFVSVTCALQFAVTEAWDKGFIPVSKTKNYSPPPPNCVQWLYLKDAQGKPYKILGPCAQPDPIPGCWEWKYTVSGEKQRVPCSPPPCYKYDKVKVKDGWKESRIPVPCNSPPPPTCYKTEKVKVKDGWKEVQYVAPCKVPPPLRTPACKEVRYYKEGTKFIKKVVDTCAPHAQSP